MSEINDDLTQVEGPENTDLAQLSQADSLIDRGVDDPLDEGFVAPDHWSPAQGFGNTPAEMAQNETIEQRLPQEEPEPDPNAPVYHWNPHQENRQVGSKRAGRLVAGGHEPGTDGQSVASDVGISGGAASAEEAAMHIIVEDELAKQHEDDHDETHDTAHEVD